MSKTLPLPLLDFLPSFFFSFFFFLFFFPPSFAPLPFFTSRSTPFLLTFLPRLLLLSSSRTFFYPFLFLLFSSFPLPFALPICVHRFSACRKVLPEVRRFYYRFASLSRRPIFYKKKKKKGRFYNKTSTMLLFTNFLQYIFLGNRFINESVIKISSNPNHVHFQSHR